MPSAAPATEYQHAPAFLRAIDHVLETPEGGWIAECPVWGCGQLLLVDRGDQHYTLECQGGHTTEDLVQYLRCDVSLDQGATSRKLWRAVVLSPSLEVCVALLHGQDVPRSALDPLWARRLGV